MPVLQDLCAWYASHCDGEWEHHAGISIQSCDNPGWWVKINLQGTPLLGRTFATVREGTDDDGHNQERRWLHCTVRDGVWHGAGDETRLEEILTRFLAWARSGP